jgi:hypothetical protein
MAVRVRFMAGEAVVGEEGWGWVMEGLTTGEEEEERRTMLVSVMRMAREGSARGQKYLN